MMSELNILEIAYDLLMSNVTVERKSINESAASIGLDRPDTEEMYRIMSLVNVIDRELNVGIYKDVRL